MQIHDYKQYDWNRCVGPYGNMGRVDPQRVADLCDNYGLPWYTDGWPYASGVKVYCENYELWCNILQMSKY